MSHALDQQTIMRQSCLCLHAPRTCCLYATLVRQTATCEKLFQTLQYIKHRKMLEDFNIKEEVHFLLKFMKIVDKYMHE